jgi:hypothetical protein
MPDPRRRPSAVDEVFAMRVPAFFAALFGVVLFSASGVADTLPLPASLVALDSAEGEAMLVEADARADYFPLSLQFVTQRNQAFCGVASIVMVLNALHVPAPSSPELSPFSMFDQENVFDAGTEAVLPRSTIEKMGMTLDQLGGLLAARGLKAEVHHAADTSLEAFRGTASEELKGADRFVLVNYLRKAIGQEKGGHISPLAAYDAKTDRFLILDVSRYKYPPVWVPAADLFAAMSTTDSDNENRTRGFVVVGK